MSARLIAATLLFTACGGEPATPDVAPPQPATAAPEPSLDPAVITGVGDQSTPSIVPAPQEVAAAVKAAGVADSLSSLVPSDRRLDTTIGNKKVAAVRTGVMLADAIFTASDAPKADFIARLTAVRAGMANIGAGAGLVSTMDEFIVRVENDAASRDDFLRELGQIRDMMIPDEGWGPEDETGPLVQAGGWLAGANLVASAIIQAKKPEAADDLLRQQPVVDYFLVYTRTSEAQDAAPHAALVAVDKTLRVLSGITGKPSLSERDTEEIRKQTDHLIQLL